MSQTLTAPLKITTTELLAKFGPKPRIMEETRNSYGSHFDSGGWMDTKNIVEFANIYKVDVFACDSLSALAAAFEKAMEGREDRCSFYSESDWKSMFEAD
jgi:hypothetical protein